MDFLVENLLKVEATDHRKIQEEIQENLRKLGYEVKLEKKIWAGREGKIDVFAQKGNFTVGLEIDHSQLRKKSIEKLNTLKPTLAIFLLKARNINRKATYSRAKLIKVNSLLVHLSEKRVEKIGPGFSEYKEEIPAAKQRYKKFERSKTLPKFQLTETDSKILRDLADYRFLDTTHILALHSEVPKRTIQYRLQQLYQTGFLERPVHQFSQYEPPTHIIYTLGQKGAELLFSGESPKVGWAKRNKEVKSDFLRHSLMISDFRVILTLALKEKKESKLTNWREENLSETVYLEGEKLPISPDAFFTVEDKNDLLHFFLETNRSTMPQERFLKKMKAYWQWWKVESNLTLVELPLLLTDDLIRKRILKKVKNPHCLRCFKAYERIRPYVWREWAESTLNKVDALLADHRMRHIFTLAKSSFNLREIIDNQKILLVKLEKGRLKDSADLLGSLLLSKIQMAAFSRTDIPKEKRAPFYLYIDEFQNFATKTFIDVLSEARKYGLSLILAHQNLAQLPQELRASILSNCGIQVCFQVSRDDAQIMAKELMTPLFRQPPGWEINVQRLQELEPQCCYMKNKKGGGVVPIETKYVHQPWEVSAQAPGGLDGITPETFKESVEQARIGADYLIDRKKIEREYQRRYKKLTAAEEPKTFREPKR